MKLRVFSDHKAELGTLEVRDGKTCGIGSPSVLRKRPPAWTGRVKFESKKRSVDPCLFIYRHPRRVPRVCCGLERCAATG